MKKSQMTNNPNVVLEIMEELDLAFMEDARMHNLWHTRAIIEAFEISLGNYASEIHEHTGFTDITFWKQINYYKNLFPAPSVEYTNSIRAVCCFYRWLVNKYSSYPFSMTKALEHILRNGKSDIEMGLLSKHKYLDTTKTIT